MNNYLAMILYALDNLYNPFLEILDTMLFWKDIRITDTM